MLQSHSWFFWLACLLVLAGAVASVFTELIGPSSHNLAHPAISRTAWIAASMWYLAFALRWFRVRERFRVAYVCGCALYVLHVAVAFHLAHGWSHAEAFAHVERTSGFGAGIFVSYAFTLVWLSDAMGCLLAARRYFERGAKWNVTIYGFEAFVVFNATVVFVLL